MTKTTNTFNNQIKFKTKYDGIVVCAGVNSKFIANDLGDNKYIPVKGYSITVYLTIKSEETPYVSLLDDKAKLIK